MHTARLSLKSLLVSLEKCCYLKLRLKISDQVQSATLPGWMSNAAFQHVNSFEKIFPMFFVVYLLTTLINCE